MPVTPAPGGSSRAACFACAISPNPPCRWVRRAAFALPFYSRGTRGAPSVSRARRGRWRRLCRSRICRPTALGPSSRALLCEGAEAASHAPGARPPRSPPPTCLGWCPSWASRDATLFPDRGFHVFRSKEASKSINAQRRCLGNTNGLAQRRSLRGRQRDVTVPGQSAHSRGRPSLRVAEGSMAGCRGTRLGTDSVLLHHVPVTHAKLHLEGRLKAHIRGPRGGGGRLGPQGRRVWERRRAQCPGGFSPAPPRHLRPSVSLPGAAS